MRTRQIEDSSDVRRGPGRRLEDFSVCPDGPANLGHVGAVDLGKEWCQFYPASDGGPEYHIEDIAHPINRFNQVPFYQGLASLGRFLHDELGP